MKFNRKDLSVLLFSLEDSRFNINANLIPVSCADRAICITPADDETEISHTTLGKCELFAHRYGARLHIRSVNAKPAILIY